jgi:Kdo2-lipid IVA lauroyltransferase/acyltransferase
MNWEEARGRAREILRRRKNDFVYLLALVGLSLPRLVPHRIGLRVGALLGAVAFYVLRRERQRALDHLAIALSQEMDAAQRHRVARACFANLGMNLVEIVNYPRIKKHLSRQISVEGLEHLDHALAEGRGVLWITAHLGNWELLACEMVRRGYPINVVARQVYDERLNRLLVGFREREGVRVILRESPAAGRQILQVLKTGQVLAMLIDQDTTVKGVMAEFFRRRANTPAGPAILVRRRRIPVVAGFIHRASSREHRITIYPAIPVEFTDDLSRDVQVITERFNRLIEQQIRKHPQQWVWIHRRWRRRTAYDAAGPAGGAQPVSL